MSRAAPSPEILFILRLGKALHTYGYPAPFLESSLRRVADRFGVPAQFFSTPTSLFCAFGPLESQETFLLRVEPGEVNLSKLARLHRVIGDTLTGALGPGDGVARIEEITGAPPIYGPFLILLSYAVASGGAALFLGGGMNELAIAGGIGLVIGGLALAAAPLWRRARGTFEPVASALAALLAILAAHFAGPASVYILILAGLIVLLPGFTFTVAMTELATRHLASGTARIAGAAATFLTIAFGVAVGTRVGEALVGAAGAPPVIAALPWTGWLAMLLAPLAFTVLLRAEPRDAGWILLAGLLAVGAERLGARFLGAEMAAFAGALAVGLASQLYSRLLQRPTAVTLVPGLLLLVPGSLGYRSVASLVDRDVVLGVETVFRMLFIAIALVAGLLLAFVVAPERQRE